MPEDNGYAPRKRRTMADTYIIREKPKVNPKINTNIWLDRGLHKHLKILAAKEGKTVTALIEEGIILTIREYESAPSVRRLGRRE